MSYASQQSSFAQQLEAELKTKGIRVWRDKTNLHAGERWPKALGDAIAASDAMVLLWSSEASQSDFVELEWNIAVAMQKAVMPCLLDYTDIPPTLTPSHRISGNNTQQVAEEISGAMKGLPPSTPIEQHDKLREILDVAPEADPQQVLKHFHATINLQNVKVEGNITNAGRDVIYNIYSSEEKAKAERENSSAASSSRWKPIHTWVATGAALVSIMVGGFQIQEMLRGKPTPAVAVAPNSTEGKESIHLQSVAGTITDPQDYPLARVKVLLTSIEDSTLEEEYLTSENGRFQFQIKGWENQDIRISTIKDCFEPMTKSGYLGHTTMDFSLVPDPKENAACVQ